jgi:membrane protease YdiL (CAAX protease family)
MRPVLLAIALLLPTLLTWIYFVVLANGEQANPWQQGAYAVGKVIQFAIPLLDWWMWDRRRPEANLLAPRGLGSGLGFGLLVLVAALLLYHLVLKPGGLIADTVEPVRAKVQQLGIATPWAFFAFAAFIALLHSGLEEYYWRWYGYGRLREWMPQGGANLLAALAFTSHHVILLHLYFPGRFATMVLPFSAGIVVGGAFWAWLYQRTGSLLGPWLSHALVDVAIFIIGWDLLQMPAA